MAATTASASFRSASSSSSSSSASFHSLPLRFQAWKRMPAASMASRFDGRRLDLQTTAQKQQQQHHHHHHHHHHPLLRRRLHQSIHKSSPPHNDRALVASIAAPISIDDSESETVAIPTTKRNNIRPRHANDSEAQELTVYEFNQQDRGSPVILPFNKPGFDVERLRPVGSLGMLVPFTNKLFDGSLKKRLGITAGSCMVIRYNQQKGGCLYEATYSFYFGDLGHISVQGPYAEYEDTTLAVTGGTGIFMGVYGTARLSNVKFPTSLFYRFKLFGIPKLPAELIWDTVLPTENVKPSPYASLPGFALPNFTD